MDLVSENPFWLLKNGLLANYPALDRDLKCDVAVIGGGITGALIASQLVQAGVETIVLDRRDVGQGSTSATTGLVQYEIDAHLCDLKEMIGVGEAQRAYKLCHDAIDTLASWVRTLPDECAFRRQSSLYLASSDEHVEAFRDEAIARRACGIDVTFLTDDELRARFELNAPAALFSTQAAQVDAFRLTHALFQRHIPLGLRVYDRTEVQSFVNRPDSVELRTNRGFSVQARRIVFATGYESEQYLKTKVSRLKSTYALVTQPMSDVTGWLTSTMLWESSRPYIYLRTTGDGRILMGGEDDPFRNPRRRDANIPAKSEILMRRLRALLPALTLECEYAWAGTFGETQDTLPYIGATDEFPNAYFALGFGGNGITFSVLAAEIIRDVICDRANADAHLFRFGRPLLTQS